MNGTIARLTRISLLRGWRGILLALLPVALLLLAFAVSTMARNGGEEVVDLVLGGLTMGTVVPLVALIVGTGAISTEIDDGSIVYLLTKPVPRWKIALTKIVIAIVTSLVFATIPTFLVGLIITGALGATTIAFTAASAIACVVYCSLFVMLGTLSRQAVIIGIMYILLWENLIAGLVSGTRVLSVHSWATSLVSEMGSTAVTADVNMIAAAVLAVVATIGGAWYAGRRLRSLTLAGEG